MKILVIRHGESLADILKVHEGRADFELTEKGKNQVSLLAEYIKKNFNVSVIYSSTLKRAKETAQILSYATNSSLIMKDELMEFNNGKLAGLSYEVANILYPYVDVPISESVYDMECVLDFHNRANRILEEIISITKDDETIAIISHGGLIKRLYMNFMGFEVISNVSYPSGDTGLHIWEIDNNKRFIRSSNYLEHTKNIG